MKTIESTFPLFCAVPLSLALAACNSGYETRFPPPSGKETYAEVLPAAIGGHALQIEPIATEPQRWRGATARYGTAATIEIVQSRTLDDLDAYVDGHLKPRLQPYSTRVSGKVNGVWGLRGNGAHGRLHAWQNQAWLFTIEARNDDLFDEAVDQFAYIAKR